MKNLPNPLLFSWTPASWSVVCGAVLYRTDGQMVAVGNLVESLCTASVQVYTATLVFDKCAFKRIKDS